MSQCKDKTFAECELTILRMAVDKAEAKMGKRAINSDEVQRAITIVENFIRDKHLVCYGGTAINNILPEDDQFYDKDVELPDYDFFSDTALDHAKELADIYYKAGFTNVEAKSGVHHGTFKVFVNYMGVADITQISPEIFSVVKRESLSVNRILYAPPNFLRMSMYLELSRPAGDTSRWEKVLKRLTLLNKNYPITDNSNCAKVDFQREMTDEQRDLEQRIFDILKDTLVAQGAVFFGGFANTLYSQYMPKHLRKALANVADFDVLANDPEACADIVRERLADAGIQNVKIKEHPAVGEIVPQHYEVIVKKDSVLFIYKPIGCHSYNVIKSGGHKIKVATIDTMLSFYLAFLYADQPYYNEFLDRILCMSKFLFDVQQKNRLAQKGLLRRFSITCYGHQETLEEIKTKKAEKYAELKAKKNKREFEEWFLNYAPDSTHVSKVLKTKKNKKKKTRKHKNKKSGFNLFGGTRKRR